MWIVIFIVLLIVWLVLWLGLHITAAAIHLILVLAIISLIVHFVMGSRRV